jgi:HEAT repeat protein
LKKSKQRRTITQIIEDRYSNWKEKALFLDSILDKEEESEEIFIQIIRTHPKEKLRKGAASILGYLKRIEITEQLFDQIFKEPKWSVRYPLAQAFGKQCGNEAIEKLIKEYNELTKDCNEVQKHRLKVIFAETLGLMGLSKGIPLLTAILKETGNKRDEFSIELIIQCLYSLGEIKDKSVVEFLLLYSAESQYSTESIRRSANHAIDKIAKNYGLTSKQALLDEINKEN